MLGSLPRGNGPRLPRAAEDRACGLRRLEPPQAVVAAPTQPGSRQRPAQQASTAAPKEVHKIFDEAFITVRSGNGGRGELVPHGKGKRVDNFKWHPGSSQPKRIWLPAADPAAGSDGASVVLQVNPDVDDLVHLHERQAYSGRNGANANPAIGSSGPHRFKGDRKQATPPLCIAVPPGTLVKKKKSGQLLGELLVPGETLVVARGGVGGAGAAAPAPPPSKRQQFQDARRRSKERASGVETVDVEDSNWSADLRGAPGEELQLHVLLRLVADVGIVGLPNAGKSSLLACLTRASPEVADYPFTTLRPNLGALSRQEEASGAAAQPVLADLPGLIAGAHQGRGLGKNFLRHLRRTTGMLHVLDAAAADPAEDYRVVREELRLYNPQYCQRPHVVALNKADLAGGRPSLLDALSDQLQAMAARLQAESQGLAALPLQVVVTSAAERTGLEGLHAAVRRMLLQARRDQQARAEATAANMGLDW